MASKCLSSKFLIISLICAIFLSAVQYSLPLRIDSDSSAKVRSKRGAPHAAGNVEEPVTPPLVGGSNEVSTKSKKNLVPRQAHSSSEVAPPATTTTSTTTTSTTTTTTTPVPTTTTTTTPATTTTTTETPTEVPPNTDQDSMATLSDFLSMNYSYTDQTSFENGTHDWDFAGTWSKTNLSATEEDKRPVPLPMKEMQPSEPSQPAVEESGIPNNSTNATVLSDQNNFVMIYTVDEFSPRGILQKSYGPTSTGEVFIRYYVALPGTAFNVTLKQDKRVVKLYSIVASDTSVGVWMARRLQFNELQTLYEEYTVVLSVAAPDTAEMGTPVLAVQHIAVGGMWPGGIPPPPAPPSNEIVTPPGSGSYLEGIANSIYTALYVFLAFFLLVIIALIVVIVRGRLR